MGNTAVSCADLGGLRQDFDQRGDGVRRVGEIAP